MARIIYSGVIDGIAGKVGGSVFQRGRSGNVFKNKPIPRNPQSDYQKRVRAIFAEISKRWGTITEAQREAWNELADQRVVSAKKKSFGTKFKLTGKALFQQVNGNLRLVSSPFADAPPAPGSTDTTEITSLTIDLTNDKVNLIFRASPLSASFIILGVTPTLSAGTSFYKGKYKSFYYRVLDTTKSIVDVTLEFKARFGNLPLAGSNLAAEVRKFSTTGYNAEIVNVPILFA